MGCWYNVRDNYILPYIVEEFETRINVFDIEAHRTSNKITSINEGYHR